MESSGHQIRNYRHCVRLITNHKKLHNGDLWHQRGYAPEPKPGIYDYAGGSPVKLNSKAVFDEIKVAPPHDGKHDFYPDFSGGVPVTYVR